MPKVVILSEADLRACVSLDAEAIDCVEQAFHLLATAPVVMPPILRLDIAEAHGEVDVKTAYLPGVDSFAIKVSPGFFDNPKLGLPSLNGMMMLLSARTGLLQSLLLDNGYLTAIRTAAAGAVAARWLARADAGKVAIIGAGEQAGLQLRALTLVRPVSSATVWAPNPDKAARFAQRMTSLLSLPVRACADVDEALADADIAVTATPSTRPLIFEHHLRPGLHITAMGSDASHKNEISPTAVKAVDLYVCDRLSQVRILGELRHAIAQGVIDEGAPMTELGQIIAGQSPGRRNDDDITLCDLTGTGAQDTAIAALAHARALRSGLGLDFQS